MVDSISSLRQSKHFNGSIKQRQLSVVELGVCPLSDIFYNHVFPGALLAKLVLENAVGMYNVKEIVKSPTPFESTIPGPENEVSAVVTVDDDGYPRTKNVENPVRFRRDGHADQGARCAVLRTCP